MFYIHSSIHPIEFFAYVSNGKDRKEPRGYKGKKIKHKLYCFYLWNII